MSEEYFFVRKLGLGKEVMSLSLVVTEVSRACGMRWAECRPIVFMHAFVWLEAASGAAYTSYLC